jgi:L-lactate dehydrogenase (cytochrome)
MQIYKSGQELAREIGVPASRLQQTFDEYNANAKANKDSFGKQFFRNTPYTLNDTFHVSIVTPVVHYTMGGLHCNASAEVLSQAGPIPGLYAAGEVIGGIHGVNRLGGSSLLDCVVYGRIAGRTAARFLLQACQNGTSANGGAPVRGATDEVVEFDWANKKLTIRSGGAGSPKSAVSDAASHAPSQAAEASENTPPEASKRELKVYTMEEVAKHNAKSDCWVVLHDEVYDVTAFLEDHPGGAASILAYAGKDASKQFDMLHSPDIITKYGDDYRIGTIKGGASKRIAASATIAPESLTMEEVAKHNTSGDCWCVIHGKVYDLTSFLSDHPGGSKIIVKYAGKDGTAAFDASGHPTDIVSQLGLDHLCLGDLHGKSAAAAEPPRESTTEPIELQTEGKPPLSQILNLFDFEAVARKVMSQQGWAYYSSGAEDEIAMRENHAAFHRLWLRPRILIDVSNIDLRSTMLGYPVAMPVYITSCALGRLAHPDGEMCLTRAAGKRGVIQLCPTLASCKLEEMTGAAIEGQTLFLQLYVNHNRQVSERLIRRAEKQGIRAIFVTVDAPQLGRREKDMRMKFAEEAPDEQRGEDDKGEVDRSQGAARTISQFIDPALCWKDIDWLRSVTKLPLILKGVQTAEDAILAAERGLEGIVCSNHGGRQLDFARSGIEVLVEVMSALRERGLEKKLEVYMDGGIRRGSDVLKALCLGAKAVGIGRPTLYAMAGYGSQGVERVFQILEDEMIMNMRLMGAPAIKDLRPEMISLKSISDHITSTPRDSLAEYVYQPLTTQAKL